MKKEGYPDHFAAALSSMASVLGPLIPPSITLIVYGSITDTPISKLFLASVIPGVLLFLLLILYTMWYGQKRDLPSQPRKSMKEVLAIFKDSIWALLMPVIILGGIFGGVFTPTEAAAISVIYALLISIFVYKDMTFKDVHEILISSALSTTAILMLVGLSKASSYVVVTSGLPQSILSKFASITDNKIFILLLINVLFLLIGMLMEANAAIVMMTPLLLPLMRAYQIDPIQFGLLMSVNLYIGLMTPPVGVSILLGNKIAEAKLEQTIKSSMPLLLIGIFVLMMVTYLPKVTTWLPSLLN